MITQATEKSKINFDENSHPEKELTQSSAQGAYDASILITAGQTGHHLKNPEAVKRACCEKCCGCSGCTCNATGEFNPVAKVTINGHPERGVILDGSPDPVRIRLCQIKFYCPVHDITTTHVILPDWLAPYSQLRVVDQAMIMREAVDEEEQDGQPVNECQKGSAWLSPSQIKRNRALYLKRKEQLQNLAAQLNTTVRKLLEAPINLLWIFSCEYGIHLFQYRGSPSLFVA